MKRSDLKLKKWLALMAAPLAVTAAWQPATLAQNAAPAAYVTRIDAVNGNQSLQHDPAIYVNEGDTIALSADLLSTRDYTSLLGADAKSFAWSTDDQANDACDMQAGACGGNFQASATGVNFVVPSFGDATTITISVFSHDPKGLGTDGFASTDTLVLTKNGSVQTQAPISGPTQAHITSVNSSYDANHATEIYVHPGDMIQLSADLLSVDSAQALGAPVESFIWRANDSASSLCDASSGADCLNSSNFQVTDYGVSYYVPNDIGQSVKIIVASSDPSSINSDGKPRADQINLINQDYVANAPVVSDDTVVTDASDYPYASYDDDQALENQGHWVWIDNVRYFVPYTYISGDEDEWVPYRHGYWAFDPARGETWVSYDPWGWVTDHRGVWRRHENYGWVWMPFKDHHYEANGVMFFDNGNQIGWIPYNERYRQGYLQGREHGFIDGFEQGRNLHQKIGRADFNYRPGYTVINRVDVGNRNIHDIYRNHHMMDQNTINMVRGVPAKGFSGMPGGNIASTRKYLERDSKDKTPALNAVEVRGKGGAKIITVMRDKNHPVPLESMKAAQTNRTARRVPVGTVVSIDGNGTKVRPPTTNGRSVSLPPRVIRGGEVKAIEPVRARVPAQMNKENSVVQTRPEHKGPRTAPTPVNQLPVYNPKKSAPVAVKAQSEPIARPVVKPPVNVPKDPRPRISVKEQQDQTRKQHEDQAKQDASKRQQDDQARKQRDDQVKQDASKKQQDDQARKQRDDQAKQDASKRQQDDQARKQRDDQAKQDASKKQQDDQARKQRDDQAKQDASKRQQDDQARKQRDDQAKRDASKRQQDDQARKQRDDQAKQDASKRQQDDQARKQRDDQAKQDASKRQQDDQARKQRDDQAKQDASKRQQDDQARKQRDDQAKQDASKRQQDDQARKQRDDQAKQDASKKQQDDQARKQQEDSARKQQEDSARKQQEDSARKQQEDSARKQQEDSARKQQEDAARKQRDDQAKQDASKKQQDDQARKQQEDSARKQQEDSARKQQEDAARKQQEDAARKQQEDAARKQQEDAARKQQEDAARKQQEAQRKH